MTSLSPASPCPFVALSGFRFRLWPILFAALLMQGLLELGRIPARVLYRAGDTLWTAIVSVFLPFAIAFQALLCLIGDLILRRLLPASHDHSCWPPGRSYGGLAVLVWIGMGLVMLVSEYWPAISAQAAPDMSYSKYPLDSACYLLGMITTGLAEETIFRVLLVGMLVVLVPGRLRIGSLDLPVAAYIVALMFGLAHWKSFTVDPFYQAMAQLIYAFVWGLIYVWLMERSRSLFASMVAHGMGNFTEVAIVIALNAMWV